VPHRGSQALLESMKNDRNKRAAGSRLCERGESNPHALAGTGS
jgi:hypothetical protein